MRVRTLVSGSAAWGLLASTVVLVGCAKHADFLEMRNQEQQLEREIRELRVKNAELHLEVDRLRYDPERLEELAREQLGFVRKGETVYQLAPSGPSGGAGSVTSR